jgi:hypothetical protein
LTHDTQTFTVVDPRTFDGDEYEVAERACKQAQFVGKHLATCISTASIMGRNAQMSRDAHLEGEPQARAWEDSIYGRKFARAEADAQRIVRDLEQLATAMGFNPKKAR